MVLAWDRDVAKERAGLRDGHPGSNKTAESHLGGPMDEKGGYRASQQQEERPAFGFAHQSCRPRIPTPTTPGPAWGTGGHTQLSVRHRGGRDPNICC